MLRSTEALLEAGLVDRLINTHDLKYVFGGTAASRYALVNKSLKKGELIQLKRGLYILNQKYCSKKISLFHLACQMEPHSYISLESSLSYHGWIPEYVTVISSVVHGRRTKSLQTPLGRFHYQCIPTQPFRFLTGVVRVEIDGQPFLIAEPLRALMDYVYEKKIIWVGLDYLTESLRVDIDLLLALDEQHFAAMKTVYRSKRVLLYIEKLKEALYKNEWFNH